SPPDDVAVADALLVRDLPGLVSGTPDAALRHHLLEISQAQVIGQVPADAQQDHRAIEVAAFEDLNLRNVAGDVDRTELLNGLRQIPPEALRMAFYALKREAAPGVDGRTWRTYEADLDRKIADLHDRVQRGAYRPLPSRRRYIPKPDGRQRPLAVAAL
ncbi:MAG: ltrA, partial [Microvirga sp.]|nr:ltrA [Microvirga sp.]